MIIYNLIKAIRFLWVLPFLLFLTNCRQPVIPTEEGVQHEFQAGDIRGIYSGKLMCETRHDNRSTRRPRRNVEETSESAEGAQEQEASKSTTNRRGGGPRQGMGRGRRQGNNRANKKTQEQQAEA